jgi:hypothetical protein
VTTDQTLARANPVRDDEVRLVIPEEWSEETLSMILGEPLPGLASKPRFPRRKRVVVVAVLALAVLALPTYAVGRAVKGWLDGDPAPPSVVRNFGSYTPQLGFRPEPGKAVRVAADGGSVLYATPNDRGSYCVATSTPDGGICIQPKIAALPLIAGIMPARTLLVAGRVDDSRAVKVTFTDPDGATVVRPLEAGGFFIAALPDSLVSSPKSRQANPCRNGDWQPVFRALGQNGDELFAAQITLASRPFGAPPGISCGWANGPHE